MSHEDNNMVNEGEVMESSNIVNELEQVLEDNNKTKLPRRRLNKNWISDPNKVYEEECLDDDIMEPPTDSSNDKVGKKTQRKQKSVSDADNSREIMEMWDSITNNSKDGSDKVKAKRPKKDVEIDELFRSMKKKRKVEKTAEEIAMLVEKVMASLEIAVEDDIELNKQGKPAVSKLMKLPLLNEALSKIKLQETFLDHGVINLLKNWLEPLPDGSLPNINIREAVLKILNDLRIDLEQECRREQMSKSGLGKVLMFLSISDEETRPNKRLANALINKWNCMIYNKSTRYENMLTQEELEKNEKILLRRQNKKAALPKVPETKARRDFNVELDFESKRRCKLASIKGMGRVTVPQAMSMDFVVRPHKVKVDKKLKALVKYQMDDSCVHERIIDRLKARKTLRRQGHQSVKLSATRAHIS